jgi:hypothetical protein
LDLAGPNDEADSEESDSEDESGDDEGTVLHYELISAPLFDTDSVFPYLLN